MKRLLIFLKDYKKESFLAPTFKMLEAIFELLVPIAVSIQFFGQSLCKQLCLVVATTKAAPSVIGSPPGYVGYDEAGQLTEKVRRRPYSVILFDEIEKAHPDVMNILLQILDEGKIDDAQGRTVSFENTIIIMTSNAGSTDRSTGMGFNRTEAEISKEKAMKALKEFLRPEFVGRIDEIIVFQPLTVENYASIAELMLKETAEALAERNMLLSWDPEALMWVAKAAHGKKYGARDIRRVLRDEVDDRIAALIMEADRTITSLHIAIEQDQLTVTIVS